MVDRRPAGSKATTGVKPVVPFAVRRRPPPGPHTGKKRQIVVWDLQLEAPRAKPLQRTLMQVYSFQFLFLVRWWS
jgi:hypothetical protein